MATTSNPQKIAEIKGKMIAVEPEVTSVANLRPTDCNKTIEVIVYRKWTSKHVQTRQPTKFCCILMDKQSTPIQANMDVKDADFPEHYFNLASYNELPARADVRNATLIDYVGRIQAVSRIYTSGDVTSNRTHRRIIDIQNLSGNIIGLTLWHEMALNFNMQEYEAMEKPVVIAVSSCWVRQFNGLQLSRTSATHYYLSPNIPETYHIKQQYQQLVDTKPILNIDNQRYEDLEQEKNRNRFPLALSLRSIHKTTSFVILVTGCKVDTPRKQGRKA
ncbi:nucleic acid-binding, OB-fold protein [Tanacetum coccineum]|uniref:Nucleic acid-binding, OB-fold protein n=1 Tax=Tanacetum coccineum TaxID=301880 RepID=A0ABQ5BDV0_9ASTR